MAVYYKMERNQVAPNNIYRIRLKELSVQRFHPFKLLFKNVLDIDLLLFDKPEVIMINKFMAFNEDRPPRPRKSPFQFIKPFVDEIRINEVSFKDAGFKYYNNNGPTATVDSVSHVNIALVDYLISSTSADDPQRFYLAGDIHISLNNYSYPTADGMYRLSLEHLNFSASTGKLNIRKLAMEPRYPEMEFGRKLGYSADRFNILMNDVNFNGLDLPLYVKKQEIMAQTMDISNGTVSVFTDNSLPKKKRDRTGRFPHQLLQKLNTRLTIQKINLNNINVSYAEFDADSRQKGVITFENTHGSISNATNAEKIKKINPFMLADLETSVMGQGTLSVHFAFNLLSTSGAFTYSGKLGQLDGRQINRITRPLGMLAVNRAKIQSLDFNIVANEQRASGTMAFAFNDLSVSLFKKDISRDKLVRLGLMSFLANNLLLVKDNPSQDGKFVRAKINYVRPVTSSFFSFIWRSLFMGVKYSVGITPERERKLQIKIDQFEQYKSSRQERKAREGSRRERK